ncbi:alcohol dehydrogenase [Dentipellis sp. KUC8613]|nr:alcohol dehydrogenase [Dentipellis sp. KUC8613]
MKAFVVTKYEHPSQIPLDENAPEPKVGKNQVLVDVHSAACNFFDILSAQGKYQAKPPFPFVLGGEFAGTISQSSPIPPGCPFARGQRVFGGGALGAYAERLATPWTALQPLPDALTFDQGAGLYMTYPTSYEALVGRAKLQPGEWVLVLAAAGGVGLCAVQLAKALGGKVIAACSPSKLSVTIEQGGADYAVDYTKKDWQKEVMQITGGKGVQVVYDPVGKIRESLKCIAWGGRAIVVGFAGGEIEKIPMNLVLLKNCSLVGVFWGSYIEKNPAHIPEVWKALQELLSSGRVKPSVYAKTYTLGTVGQALSDLENRKTWGKAVVRVRDEQGREVKEDVQAKL